MFDPIAYINEPRWQESRLGLDRISALLNRMGNPQNKLKFVHIAGTNGKGSVSAYLEYILRNSDYKTGLFTSPYIFDFEERIRVNGQNISKKALTEVTLFVREHAEAIALETGEHASEFELMCAVAFEHFARAGCDIVVCEVGLGGRLDSTNIIQTPDLCIITRIGLDHTQLLGNTLASVAAEKAGIIKHDCPLLSWPQEPEALRVIQKRARVLHAPLHVPDFSKLEILPIEGLQRDVVPHGSVHQGSVAQGSVHQEGVTQESVTQGSVTQGSGLNEDDLQGVVSHKGNATCGNAPQNTAPQASSSQECATQDATPQGHETQKNIYRNFNYRAISYQTQLLGTYQPANASLAIEAAKLLAQKGWNISADNIKKGIAQTKWPGRFEIVQLKPLIIFDGGHNPQGASALSKSLADIFPDRLGVFICAVLGDKDYPAMISPLIKHAQAFIALSSNNPRALNKNTLALTIEKIAREQGASTLPVYTAESFDEAFTHAFKLVESTREYANTQCKIVDNKASLNESIKAQKTKPPFQKNNLSVDLAYKAQNEPYICVFGSLYNLGEAAHALKRF